MFNRILTINCCYNFVPITAKYFSKYFTYLFFIIYNKNSFCSSIIFIIEFHSHPNIFCLDFIFSLITNCNSSTNLKFVSRFWADNFLKLKLLKWFWIA